MKKVKISGKWRTMVALAIIGIALTMATGFQGYGPVSSSQVAFTNVSAPGVSVVFQNFSQASHWLTYCPNAAVSAIQIELDASLDGTTWFSITPPGTAIGPGCTTLEAGGYFPYVHANLVSIAGGGGTVSAFYSASSYAIPDGGIGQQGKSSQPVTYVAPVQQQFAAFSCGTPTAVLTGASVVYGIHIYNPTATNLFSEVKDTTGGASFKFDVIYNVPANSDKEIIFPTEGLQFNGGLTLNACTSASADGTLRGSMMFKTNPTVTTQSGSTGVVAQTKPGAAQ